MKKLVVFFVFLLLTPHCAHALGTQEIYGALSEQNNTAALDAAVPERAKAFADGQDLQTDAASELFDPIRLVAWLWRACRVAFAQKKTFFVQLTALLVLMYVVRALCSGLNGEKTRQTMHYAAVIGACVIVFESVFAASDALTGAFEDLCAFAGTALPVMTGLAASSGLPAGAAGLSGTAIVALNGIAFVGGTCIVPAVHTYLALGLGACLTDNENLKAISKFCRSACIVLVTLLLCVFVGVIGLQSVFTGSADTLSRRAATFAAGNFIPVGGGYIGEGVDLVFSCASALRGAAGTFAAAVLFLTVGTPVAGMAVDLFAVVAAKAFCAFFDNQKLAALFAVMRDAFAIMLSAVLGAAFLLTVCMTALARVGG